MQKPALAVLAAGMGSRFGGLKQIEPLGPNGEMILDYSIYDAYKAGFEQVIFLINDKIYEEFDKLVGERARKLMDVKYAFQRVDNMPDGFLPPEDRVKPWGTAHAVLCLKDVVKGPFCVVNADDFYGRDAFRAMYDFLSSKKSPGLPTFSMVAYRLLNTLTENGPVSRGVCKLSRGGYLESVTERLNIQKFADAVKHSEDGTNYFEIPEDSLVSLNFWGFSFEIFPYLEEGFKDFLSDEKNDRKKGEYYLPYAVDNMIKRKEAEVRVLETNGKWFGVTYKEDIKTVRTALSKLHEEREYPRLR